MARILQYMIHCTDTPPWVKVNRSTLYRWHLGPKKNKDGSVMYLGKLYESMNDAPLSPIHQNFVGRGWSKFGYHKLFSRDGKSETLVKINEDHILSYDEMTWGCSGQNVMTYHVALVGGRLQNNKSPKKHMKFHDLFTNAQFFAIQNDIKEFLAKHDNVQVCGHYHHSKRKKCPNFDVSMLGTALGLDIYFL